MATLSDFLQPSATSPQFAIAEDNIKGGYASTDAGLAQARNKRDFETINLPSLVNNEAAKGSFYSGNAGVRADQLKQGYLDQQSDVSRQLQRTLADLARQRIYATLGVSY